MNRIDTLLGGHDRLSDTLDAVVDETLRIGQPSEIVTHQVGEFGVDFADTRNDAQPHLVAQIFGRTVRRVLAERDAVGDSVFGNLTPRSEHQRPDDASEMGRNTGQSAQTGTSQKVDEKSLDGIIGMVGDGDDIVTLRAAKLLEPRITQPPSGHFHRFARALHLTGRVETSVVTRHAQFGSLLSNQHFVFVAFGPPQLEIAMGDPRTEAAAREQ